MTIGPLARSAAERRVSNDDGVVKKVSHPGKNWICEMGLSRIHHERTVTDSERERDHQLATVDYASRTPSRAGTRNFSAKGKSTYTELVN